MMLNENFQFNFDQESLSSDPAGPIAFEIKLSAKAQVLHNEALKRAGRYLVAESDLLEMIIKVDEARLYEDFKETHLTPYCVKHLGLSQDVA